jgi:phosphoglycolate phosphatase
VAAIIFDFDGTIVDTFDYVVEFLSSEAGVAALDSTQKEALRNMSMIGMAKKLGFKWWRLPKLGLRGRRKMEQSIKYVKPFNGMPELLKKLHNEGHVLYIVSTNSLSNIHNFLHSNELHKYFLEVYGGIGYFSKTTAIKNLFKEQGLKSHDCIYVGDEVRDVQAAKAAGTHVIAVGWGFASLRSLRAKRPTALAMNVGELMSILENI